MGTNLIKNMIAILLLIMMPLIANAAVQANGKCGDNVTWSLTTDGVLTISGSGNMADYGSSDGTPWSNVRNSIKSVVVAEGVTSIGQNAFSGCTILTSITIPESVTSIEYGAFYSCPILTSIIIPDGVTSIGDEAFYGCHSLASITIPESVTSIGSQAFCGCSSLASITIPESVTSIGTQAFYGCSSLASINILNGVTSIGRGAFWYCSSLASITIPESVTSIEEYAFYGCSSLANITIPESVTSIGGYAFSDCRSLTSITIPESVTSIGESAFRYCSSLTSITIPESVISIGVTAFAECDRLTSITIPKSVTNIGQSAFDNCDSLASVTSLATTAPALGQSAFANIPSDATLRYPAGSDYSAWEQYFAKSEPFRTTVAEGTCGTSLTWVLTIDSTLIISGTGAMTDYGSTATPWNSYNSQITSVVMNDGVTSIGVRAFNSCTKLTSVSIPASVAKIGHRAFFGCSSLAAITIPDAVTSIEEKTFDGCGKLATVNLGNGMKTIKNSAFYGCRAITAITLPASMTSLSEKAFYNCSSLAAVTSLATTAPTLQSSDAFANIPSNATLHYPAGSDYSTWMQHFAKSEEIVAAVAEGTCGENLTWVLTNNGKLIISGTGAMTDYGSTATPWNSYNSQITSVVMNDGVTSIGVRAFNSCTKLTSVSIPASVAKIGHRAFFGCSSLAAITIPDAVTSIEEKTFDGCGKLATVNLGNGLQSIRNSAFNGNRSLTSITLPASLKNIDTKAFGYCTGLTEVKLLGTSAPTVAADAFANVNAATALHLPAGTVKAYKSAGWTMFTNIVSPCTLTVTVNDPAMGSATLSDTVVNYGTSATVQIAPASGYRLKRITANGTDLTALVENSSCTIDNIEEATAIYGEFEKSDYCTVSIDDMTAVFGAMADLPVVLTNTYSITAMQFDITLPDGVTAATDGDGAIIAALNPDRAAGSHAITASQMGDGTIKVVIFSSDNAPLNMSDGTIASLKIHATPVSTDEPGTVILSNIRVVTPDAREIRIAGSESALAISPYIPGDANMSGTLTVSDIVAAINQMFGKPQAAFNFAAADMNCDGEISIVDIVNIVNAIIAAPAESNSTRAHIRPAASGESLRSEVTAENGKARMALSLTGSAAYTAMQMDVELPEGATLIAATSGDDSHTVAWNSLGDGTVRVVAYSLGNAPFDGETLLTLEVADADGTVSVGNVSMAAADGTETSIGGTSADISGTTGIGGTGEEIISVRYFNEAGAELKEPQQGINIVVTEYAGGKIESKKVMKK